MSLKEVIQDRIQFIEEETGNKVRKREEQNIIADALIDFNNWSTPNPELPWILYKPKINLVHILHELLHIESYFIDQYYLVGHSSLIPNISNIDGVFKQIPEDFVVHKKLYFNYGFDPINPFFNAERFVNFNGNTRDIAAQLTLLYTFIEFRPELQIKYDKMRTIAHHSRAPVRNSIRMVDQAIEVLNKTNIYDRESHRECVINLIQTFANDFYQRHEIYPIFIKKGNQSMWVYSE